MRGLDPRIHQKNASFKGMDCRVKPGNDGGWVNAQGRSRHTSIKTFPSSTTVG
jgi:hypothetical protein